jgi:hypothetical protein
MRGALAADTETIYALCLSHNWGSLCQTVDPLTYGGRNLTTSSGRNGAVYVGDTRFNVVSQTSSQVKVKWSWKPGKSDGKVLFPSGYNTFTGDGQSKQASDPISGNKYTFKVYKSDANSSITLLTNTSGPGQPEIVRYITSISASGVKVLGLNIELSGNNITPDSFIGTVKVSLDHTGGTVTPSGGWDSLSSIPYQIRVYADKSGGGGVNIENIQGSSHHLDNSGSGVFSDSAVLDPGSYNGTGGVQQYYYLIANFAVSSNGISTDTNILDAQWWNPVDWFNGREEKQILVGNSGDLYIGVCRLPVSGAYDGKGGDIDASSCNLTLKFLKSTQQGGALNGAIQSVVDWLEGITASAIKVTESFVSDNGILDTNIIQHSSGIPAAWGLMRSVANIFFLLILLIIAFANVARFNIEYYAMRALLPRLVSAVVMVNISFLLCTVMVDTANVLTAGFASLSIGGIGQGYDAVFNHLNVGDVANVTIGVGASIIVLLIALIAAIYLWLILVVRIVMVWFLIIISPIAFLGNVIPATRGMSSSWWKQFVRFAFMAPLIALVLKIGQVVVTAGLSMNVGTVDGADVGQAYLVPLLAAITLIVAATIPLMLGGKIMGTAHNMIKRGGAAAGNRVKPYATDLAGKIPAFGAAGKGRAGLANNLPGGRFIAGRIGTDKARYQAGMAKAGKMNMSHLSDDSLAFLAATRSPRSATGMAAAQAIAKNSSWGGNHARSQSIFDKYAWNSEFVSNTRKSRPDLLMGSKDESMHSLGRSAITNANVQSAAGWTGGFWSRIAEEGPGALSNPRSLQSQFKSAAAGWSPYLPVSLFGREGNEKVRKSIQNPAIMSLLNSETQQSIRTQAANAPTVAATPHTSEHPMGGPAQGRAIAQPTTTVEAIPAQYSNLRSGKAPEAKEVPTSTPANPELHNKPTSSESTEVKAPKTSGSIKSSAKAMGGVISEATPTRTEVGSAMGTIAAAAGGAARGARERVQGFYSSTPESVQKLDLTSASKPSGKVGVLNDSEFESFARDFIDKRGSVTSRPEQVQAALDIAKEHPAFQQVPENQRIAAVSQLISEVDNRFGKG